MYLDKKNLRKSKERKKMQNFDLSSCPFSNHSVLSKYPFRRHSLEPLAPPLLQNLRFLTAKQQTTTTYMYPLQRRRRRIRSRRIPETRCRTHFRLVARKINFSGKCRSLQQQRQQLRYDIPHIRNAGIFPYINFIRGAK